MKRAKKQRKLSKERKKRLVRLYEHLSESWEHPDRKPLEDWEK
jgi:hypothetical protein